MKKESSWREITRITNTDNNCCKFGDRIPGVWFQPNSYKLFVCYDLSGKSNQCYKDNEELNEKKYTNVQIEQTQQDDKYIYTIKKDGKEIYNKENTKPQDYENAKIYGGLNKRVASAKLKAVSFQNLGMCLLMYTFSSSVFTLLFTSRCVKLAKTLIAYNSCS